MNSIILGKYVNTHGIKGEIRIKSNFMYKNRVFQKGNTIIINNQEYIINSHRVHKGYDMVSLVGINDINAIPFPKNILVYIDRDKYLSKEHLDSDLIGFIVYNSEFEEVVSDIIYINDTKKLIKCRNKLIPYELVEKVDWKNKRIKIMEVSGL